MGGWGWFFLLLLLALILGAAGWIFFTRRRASRQGLPPPTLKSYIPFIGGSSSTSNYPSPRQGGPIGWLKDQIASFKNRQNRTAQGAYEEPLEGGARRGRGVGGDEEAWDARVGGPGGEYDGPGGYYEEQELGLQPAGEQTYGGSGYGQGGRGDTTFGASVERGRSRSREPEPYLGAAGVSGGAGGNNPFGEEAERSDLRDVSPRPVTDATKDGALHARKGSHDDSPTERRSMFREGL
jgi:hypothetical protein